MNPIDRAFRYFAPVSALQREKARRALHIGDATGYWRQAAVAGTNRRMSNQALNHPDSASNHTDRLTIIREARHLEENNAITDSILRKFEIFVVGRSSYIPRTQSDAVNKKIKDYVERWMRYADLTGRHSFRALASLAVRREECDGDIGFIISEPKQDPQLAAMQVCPIRLQAIEADRIGAVWNTYNVNHKPFKALGKNERDFSGVVVDKYGRPVRYRVFNRDQQSSNMVPSFEVPAQDFLHIFDPTRFDGYRGFSAFASSINDIKDVHEILACEKQTVKKLSSISGVVEGGDGTASGEVNLDGTMADTTANGSLVTKVDAGSVEHLPAGHKFVEISADRPSPTFQGFLETLIHLHALSFKLPYGLVYSWASQGTAVRMESAMADREFQQKQLMIEEKFLNPIIHRVIARGIQLGHLPAVPDFDAGEWRFPAKATADVGRESKADIEEVMAGLRAKTQVNADRGEDREITRKLILSEGLELIEDAKALVAASGGELDLKAAMWQLERRGPNAPMEPPEPAAKETE
jgi:capsid protein